MQSVEPEALFRGIQPHPTVHSLSYPNNQQPPQMKSLFPATIQNGHAFMDKLIIRGGEPLLGTVRISGAKNAALPCIAAALLTDEPVILENIPQVRDIETTRKLLAAMGAEVELGYGRAQHRTTISCRNLASPEASYELVKTMRASTLVLGPLVARCGRARVSLPGGCAIGARPIDLHIRGLETLGAKITQEHGYVEASAKRLKGAEIVFDKITVTGTEDLLMAATLAEGETMTTSAYAPRSWRSASRTASARSPR